MAAPAFASPSRELGSLPASRAHFLGAEAATLCSGTQQRPRGAQSLFPGQRGWSWAPFPAPLSRERSFQRGNLCVGGQKAPFSQERRAGTLCVCVVPRGSCASERGTRLPNDPCEVFQPQSLWKRKAEPHWWERGTSQGVTDTESYLDAPSRAVSLKANIQTSFLSLGDKNREGSLQSALLQGSCLQGAHVRMSWMMRTLLVVALGRAWIYTWRLYSGMRLVLG